MSRTTLEQVARKAKVSISTVSRVLNGKQNVNEATRRRILSILANTNYGLPEAQNSGPATRIIALLVPVAAQSWGIKPTSCRKVCRHYRYGAPIELRHDGGRVSSRFAGSR